MLKAILALALSLTPLMAQEAPGQNPVANNVASAPAKGARDVVSIPGGYEIAIDTTETPDLTAWAREQLAPMTRKWYPKLVKLLESEGFEAPKWVTVTFLANMEGVASTSGTNIQGAARWMRQELNGEAVGSIFHEYVHVIQSYGHVRARGEHRNPGWLVEGMADYLRWYLYEPESRGAEIGKRSLPRARYDGSYRVTANFINWATVNFHRDLPYKLNAAMREGEYSEALWAKLTGHSLSELGTLWKTTLEKKVANEAPSQPE
jgi:hypothetical protein